MASSAITTEPMTRYELVVKEAARVIGDLLHMFRLKVGSILDSIRVRMRTVFMVVFVRMINFVLLLLIPMILTLVILVILVLFVVGGVVHLHASTVVNVQAAAS